MEARTSVNLAAHTSAIPPLRARAGNGSLMSEDKVLLSVMGCLYVRTWWKSEDNSLLSSTLLLRQGLSLVASLVLRTG